MNDLNQCSVFQCIYILDKDEKRSKFNPNTHNVVIIDELLTTSNKTLNLGN